jgi:hypothetical protein
MSSFIVIPSKITTTTVPVVCDFTSQLADGDAVTAVIVTASVFVGVDAAPEDIIDGAATLSQNVATQVITGGLAGVIYLLNFGATTSDGNNLIISAYLAVTDTNPFQV